MADEVSKEDRLLAALCYPFWPLAFLILNLSPVLKRQPFVRYHAFQAFFLGLGIWGGMVVLNTASLLVLRLLGPFGVILGLLMYPIMKLLGLACLLVTAWCAWRAWLGDYVELPWLTEFARPFVEETVPVEDERPSEAEAGAAAPPPGPDTRDLVERVPTVETPTEEKPAPSGRKGRGKRKTDGNGQANPDEPS